MSTIECKNVCIKYISGDLKSIGLKEYVVRKLTNNYHIVEFWANKEITFSLEKGDMLGIIGINGAGKSTLLKAISGIMKPDSGSIIIQGSIAALLELASGFDDDLTVKENCYLRGAMLGYTRDFMDQKYADIIQFAELENFQEHLFKQLSSGMKSRLAFSIACLVNPDIIILDEVLSVGDGAFRKKSGDKMREILSSGITGILVSHSVDHVRELSNKILWLDHGNQIIFSEDVSKVCDAYEEFLINKKLPSNEEDIQAYAISYKKRLKVREEESNEKEVAKLRTILEEGESKASILAAYDILQKNCPYILNGTRDSLNIGDIHIKSE